ncbi:hypothetical protein LSG31_08450 [Fodinisporobacter ferrooxydans]|uniref:Uncharacterized protein n=1 Tax=Fodinisporobacter ferrooxydans TaxID=2901836 RepID=A0ABY4CNW2_9BACL|nr:hypothetical protein LSG31_08450 [Alicyclobacillaceae bacterium MYW30-H2]
MAVTAVMARQHLGRMVHVHSVYGWHRGVVTHVLPDGIMLGNAVRLANGTNVEEQNLTIENYKTDTEQVEFEQVFFGAGMFLPFGGMFGMYPFGGFGAGFFF